MVVGWAAQVGMRTDAAGGILQGIDPTLGQQLLDEAVGAHVGAQRGRRGGLQSLGAVQLAQSQQTWRAAWSG